MSNLSQILWSIAGADKDVLLKCKTDQNKYANIGIVILLTSGVAFCAGSFAAYYFSCNSENPEGNIGYSMSFGVLWSLLIFSIDRALVVTLQKKTNSKRFWWFFPFLARFFLAALIACMISIPIELFIFQDYIKRSEMIYKSANSNTFIDNYSGNSDIDNYRQLKEEDETQKNNLSSQLNVIDFEIEQLKDERDELVAKKNDPLKFSTDYKSAYNKYLLAKSTYEQVKHVKQKRQEIRELKDAMTKADNIQRSLKEKWINKHSNQITLIDSKIDSLSILYREVSIKFESADSLLNSTSNIYRELLEKRKSDKKDNEMAQESGNSFIRNYSILEWAVSKDNPINQGKLANEGLFLWLIRLLFLIIEILPTIVKISTPYGAYDKAIEELEKYEEKNFDPKKITYKEKKKKKKEDEGFSNFNDNPEN